MSTVSATNSGAGAARTTISATDSETKATECIPNCHVAAISTVSITRQSRQILCGIKRRSDINLHPTQINHICRVIWPYTHKWHIWLRHCRDDIIRKHKSSHLHDEGLDSVKYVVLKSERRRLYTFVSVSILQGPARDQLAAVGSSSSRQEERKKKRDLELPTGETAS